MKSMDEYGLKMCVFQAELFENSVLQQECSSKVFIRRFMYSDLAARIDAEGFFYESTGIIDAFDELDRQYGKTSYGNQKFGMEEMHWIGYMYRYWAYTYEKSSKQLYKFIKPEVLRDLYFSYHSLDPSQAIERILEARGVDDRDQIARGVEIMRRNRKNAQRVSRQYLMPGSPLCVQLLYRGQTYLNNNIPFEII